MLTWAESKKFLGIDGCAILEALMIKNVAQAFQAADGLRSPSWLNSSFWQRLMLIEWSVVLNHFYFYHHYYQCQKNILICSWSFGCPPDGEQPWCLITCRRELTSPLLLPFISCTTLWLWVFGGLWHESYRLFDSNRGDEYFLSGTKEVASKKKMQETLVFVLYDWGFVILSTCIYSPTVWPVDWLEPSHITSFLFQVQRWRCLSILVCTLCFRREALAEDVFSLRERSCEY